MRTKKFSRRAMLKASSASALAGVFAAPLAAAPAPAAVDPALIAAARKEGSLAFYTAMEIPIARALAARFQANHPGINVRVKRSGAERVFQRIGEEEEIRIHEVDVVCSTDAGHFVRWKSDGLLASYVPEDVARHFPPGQADTDGMYATAFALLSPIGYNTNLVKPEEAPRSFADLLDPRWKGKIVKGRPDYSGAIFTATFQIARDLGWSYFEQLARQQVTQVQSASEPPKKLASGAAAVAADGSEPDLLLLREQHAPVEPVYPSEGTPLVIAPSAVFPQRAQSQRGTPVSEFSVQCRGAGTSRSRFCAVLISCACTGAARTPHAFINQADERRSGRYGGAERGDQGALQQDLRPGLKFAFCCRRRFRHRAQPSSLRPF